MYHLADCRVCRDYFANKSHTATSASEATLNEYAKEQRIKEEQKQPTRDFPNDDESISSIVVDGQMEDEQNRFDSDEDDIDDTDDQPSWIEQGPISLSARLIFYCVYAGMLFSVLLVHAQEGMLTVVLVYSGISFILGVFSAWTLSKIIRLYREEREE